MRACAVFRQLPRRQRRAAGCCASSATPPGPGSDQPLGQGGARYAAALAGRDEPAAAALDVPTDERRPGGGAGRLQEQRLLRSPRRRPARPSSARSWCCASSRTSPTRRSPDRGADADRDRDVAAVARAAGCCARAGAPPCRRGRVQWSVTTSRACSIPTLDGELDAAHALRGRAAPSAPARAAPPTSPSSRASARRSAATSPTTARPTSCGRGWRRASPSRRRRPRAAPRAPSSRAAPGGRPWRPAWRSAWCSAARAPGYLAWRQAQDRGADALLASHLRALQPGHLIDVPTSDRHEVKPWFDGRVDYAPPVKDLAAPASRCSAVVSTTRRGATSR